MEKAEKVRGCQRAESGSGACRCWPSALALRGQLEGQLGSLVTSRGAAVKTYSGPVSLRAVVVSFTGCPWGVLRMDYAKLATGPGPAAVLRQRPRHSTGHAHLDGCGRSTPFSSRMRTSPCDNEENMLKGMQPYLHRALAL